MSGMQEIDIDGRVVGAGKPTLVIAELGVNHDGSVSKALELVRMAANCGADAIKIQIFKATILMHPSGEMAEYQKQRLKAESPIDMLRRYELNVEDIRKIIAAARELKLIPLATPFSPTDLESIERFRLPAIKIASPDLVNRPLLAAAAKLKKPLLISTGGATLEEIDETCRWLQQWNAPYSLLHCVSSYPVPRESANLCWIGELASRYHVPVGYSDHTTETLAGAFASAAGAVIVEKHLTFDREAKGPDHAASADPAQFERYVKHIREADALRGAPGKHLLECEQDTMRVSRQSLILRHSIPEGQVLKEEDLTVQRPGTGMPAAEISRAIGRTATRALSAGSMLQWDMLDNAA